MHSNVISPRSMNVVFQKLSFCLLDNRLLLVKSKGSLDFPCPYFPSIYSYCKTMQYSSY
jgi:hypothetical protein